ncbi:MAG: putative glycoside hydrolase [Roseiflexaceae bacterium]
MFRIVRFISLRSVIVLLFAVFLAACNTPSVPLTGTVIDAYTNQPVVSAVVRIGSQKVMTDSQGRYSMLRWNTNALVEISMSDYETQQVNLREREWTFPVTAADAVLDVTIRPNVIRGRILDAWTKQPLAGVQITASETISMTTAADGVYQLLNVPEQFTLLATYPDYVSFSQTLTQQTMLDVTLANGVLQGTVTDQYSGAPLAGVTVSIGDTTTTTDAQGQYQFRDLATRDDVTFTLDGYSTIVIDARTTSLADAVLRPDELRGVIVSAVDDAPIQHATVVATEALDTLGIAQVRIDNTNGEFVLKGVPESGFLQILAPGYRKLVVPIEAGKIPDTLKLEPFIAKAVYITSAVASNPNLVERFFDQIDRTELNAIVIDLKSDLRDDLGLVYYDSQVPLVKELGIAYPYYDIKAILAEAKRRNIYTIARIHIFSHDNVLAEAMPEWAAKDRTTGGIFYEYPTSTIKYAWLDPFNENVWDYNIALAQEAALYGFDEINYDYIRFPSLEFGANDGARLLLSQDPVTPEVRYETITRVLAKSQPAIHAAGAFLSVDIFGFTTEGPIDIIGQSIPTMSDYTDYVSPMVYPSHYGTGYLGYANPAQYPYEVILRTMEMGQKQLEGKRARLRPWLQDFTLVWVPQDQIVQYGADEVRAQIRAVQDADTEAGWLLYSSSNTYTYDALQPE